MESPCGDIDESMKTYHREINIMVYMSGRRDVFLIVYGRCLELVLHCSACDRVIELEVVCRILVGREFRIPDKNSSGSGGTLTSFKFDRWQAKIDN